MKRSYIIPTILFICILSSSKAQKLNEGVFLTPNDFSNVIISYGEGPSNNNYKFRLNSISFRSPLVIKIGSRVIKLNKDSIFGYRNNKGICFRFFNNRIYKVLDPKGKLLLYSTTSIIGEPRNIHRVTNYFFSENSSSPIYPLSKLDLKRVLPNDVSFQMLLDVYFPGDKDLLAYDGSNNLYLLNRVYKLSLQPICKMNHN